MKETDDENRRRGFFKKWGSKEYFHVSTSCIISNFSRKIDLIISELGASGV